MAADTLSGTLRTLDQEATPGPWVASEQHSDAVNGRRWRIESDADGYPNDGWVIASEAPGPDGEANARLIAYVRTHLPEIISHLEAGWQPIEQAPKDGTLLDLWVVFTGYDGRREGERKINCRWRKESATYAEGWHDCYGNALEWAGEPYDDAEAGDPPMHPEYGRKVTHARALPAPPVMGEGA